MNDAQSYHLDTKISAESRAASRSVLMNATVEECDSDFGAGQPRTSIYEAHTGVPSPKENKFTGVNASK
jgi:hypothetical protein